MHFHSELVLPLEEQLGLAVLQRHRQTHRMPPCPVPLVVLRSSRYAV